jgi:hypothetical protein
MTDMGEELTNLDKEANKDSVILLTSLNTILVTVYDKGNKITTTKMMWNFMKFLSNQILAKALVVR